MPDDRAVDMPDDELFLALNDAPSNQEILAIERLVKIGIRFPDIEDTFRKD